jgi:hypothetical protein
MRKETEGSGHETVGREKKKTEVYAFDEVKVIHLDESVIRGFRKNLHRSGTLQIRKASLMFLEP